MKEFRAEAKTVEAAIEQGLEELGLRREQANWTVEQEPKSGFLGIGSRKAIVLVKEKFRSSKAGGRFHKGKAGSRGNRRDFRKNSRGNRHDDYSHRSGRYGYEDARLPKNEETDEKPMQRQEKKSYSMRRRDRVYAEEPLAQEYMNIPFIENAAEQAGEVLLKLLDLMGVEEAKVQESKLEENGALVTLSFTCKDPSEFTCDNGRMLQSLQFMLNTIINKKREPHLALRLDTDGYWEKKQEELSEVIERAAACVKASGHIYRLDPMPAAMRKLVHSIVQEKYTDIKTYSEGEGRWRKVVVAPVTAEEQNAAEQTAGDSSAAAAEEVKEDCGCAEHNEAQQGCAEKCCCEENGENIPAEAPEASEKKDEAAAEPAGTAEEVK